MTDQTEYRITFGEYINSNTMTILKARIIGAMSNQDFGSLTILFSSPGGNTEDALAQYNFIRSLPIEVHIHAMGHVGSAAFFLFLAGEKRTCADHSRFFLHEYDFGFAERQTLHRIQEATGRLSDDIRISKAIIKERVPTIPDKTLGAISGDHAPVIFPPEEAKQLGIVQTVGDLSKTGKIITWLSGTVL